MLKKTERPKRPFGAWGARFRFHPRLTAIRHPKISANNEIDGVPNRFRCWTDGLISLTHLSNGAQQLSHQLRRRGVLVASDWQPLEATLLLSGWLVRRVRSATVLLHLGAVQQEGVVVIRHDARY